MCLFVGGCVVLSIGCVLFVVYCPLLSVSGLSLFAVVCGCLVVSSNVCDWCCLSLFVFFFC